MAHPDPAPSYEPYHGSLPEHEALVAPAAAAMAASSGR